MLTLPRTTPSVGSHEPAIVPSRTSRISVVPSAALPVRRRLGRQVRYWAVVRTYHLCHADCCFLKRLFDLSLSPLLIILFLPVFGLVAALIKLTDGGPVLFWQQRVGRWGRVFAFPKFRSMVLDAENMLPGLLPQNDHGDAVVFKMKHDPRVTWIGRIIRRFSIDELPQLGSVLKGDMSLVGPRPPMPREVVQYRQSDRRRLDVLPGLTCIWQVSGRSMLPFPRQVELDLEYIENVSIWLDIKLLFRTIPAVLFGEGAY